MSKSNDKKKRTDGIIPMKGSNFPDPMNSVNNKTSAYNYTDKQKIQEQTMENKNF